MTDVRLTAVNPEDSQVYPVACNDKGELLLDSGGATGDLDVTGNLTVAGSGSFAGQLTVDSNTGGTAAYLLVQDSGATKARVNADGSATFLADRFKVRNLNGAGALELQTSAGAQTVLIDGRDGSATFGGTATFSGDIYSGVATKGQDSAGVRLFDTGNIQVHKTAADSSTTVFEVFKGGSNTPNAQLKSDGQATFAGSVTLGNGVNAGSTANTGAVYYPGGAIYTQSEASEGATNTRFRLYYGSSLNVSFKNNGEAYFAGDVTAPNINFRLAPATVAAMPAPLIDEGFAADQTVDLLSVIIEMKLQIRDLNAFMQRSIQDDPAT